MDAFFIKVSSTTLVAASDHDAELLQHIKLGQPARMTFKRVRNYDFHKKYFALLNLAFDYWEPPIAMSMDEVKAGTFDPSLEQPEKNFDRFRKDVCILCGFYDSSYRINGEVRLEAKSISFANMSEDEFENLYTKTVDVIVKHVLKNYTGEMLLSVVDQVEAFE